MSGYTTGPTDAPGPHALVGHAETGDCEAFVAILQNILGQKTNFRAAGQALAEAAEEAARRSQAPEGRFPSFVLRCLLLVAGKKGSEALAALLADLHPPTGCNLQTGDQALLGQLIKRPTGLKLSAKVLRAWRIDTAALTPEFCAELRGAVLAEAKGGAANDGASSPATVAAVLGVLPSLLDAACLREVIDLVDDGKRDDVADKLASALQQDMKIWFVKRRQEQGRLRAVFKAVSALGLEEHFPNAELEWRTQALKTALKHGSREAAVGIAFEESRLHEACVAGLAEIGELEIAEELGEAWSFPLSPSLAAAAADARAKSEELYVRPPVELQMHVVDTDSAVANMRIALSETDVMGIDTECIPSQGSPTCLLQLATSSAAFVVDLVALSKSVALAEALATVFQLDSLVKVGFDAGSDVGRMCRYVPGMNPSKVSSLVDLQQLEASQRARRSGKSQKHCREGISLSSLAQNYLGHPLNKSLQVCDWSRRPLSNAQVRYAALDAWVPVQLYKLMRTM